MFKKILPFIAVILLVVPVFAQQSVTLSTPEVKPVNTAYHLERLTIDVDALTITVQLKGVNGEALSKIYSPTTTPTGATLLHALNIGNFSGATSLVQAVYNRLLTDGVFAGTVAGVPQ